MPYRATAPSGPARDAVPDLLRAVPRPHEHHRLGLLARAEHEDGVGLGEARQVPEVGILPVFVVDVVVADRLRRREEDRDAVAEAIHQGPASLSEHVTHGAERRGYSQTVCESCQTLDSSRPMLITCTQCPRPPVYWSTNCFRHIPDAEKEKWRTDVLHDVFYYGGDRRAPPGVRLQRDGLQDGEPLAVEPVAGDPQGRHPPRSASSSRRT